MSSHSLTFCIRQRLVADVFRLASAASIHPDLMSRRWSTGDLSVFPQFR